jgi:putative transposase
MFSEERMKDKRFAETQIVKILKEAEANEKVTELCRKYGMSDVSFYNWKAKYGGMELSDVKRLKELEQENRQLKQIVADQALNIQALDTVIKKF